MINRIAKTYIPYDKAMIISAMINFKGGGYHRHSEKSKTKQSILPGIHKMPGFEWYLGISFKQVVLRPFVLKIPFYFLQDY